MHEEFKKIMSFFSLNPEQKAGQLDDVFQSSIGFFERFKHILEHGTPTEKNEMMQEVMQLQEKLKEETQKMCEQTGLSEEQLKEYAQKQEFFSDEEWKSIQSAKAKLEQQAEELSSVLPSKPVKKKEGAEKKEKGKTGAVKKKKKWVGS
jgi:thioester reductase-like protein